RGRVGYGVPAFVRVRAFTELGAGAIGRHRRGGHTGLDLTPSGRSVWHRHVDPGHGPVEGDELHAAAGVLIDPEDPGARRQGRIPQVDRDPAGNRGRSHVG